MSVSLRALTKRFGPQTAVSDITLDVEASDTINKVKDIKIRG